MGPSAPIGPQQSPAGLGRPQPATGGPAGTRTPVGPATTGPPGTGVARGGTMIDVPVAGGIGAVVTPWAGLRIVTFATGFRVEPTTVPVGRAAAIAGSLAAVGSGPGS